MIDGPPIQPSSSSRFVSIMSLSMLPVWLLQRRSDAKAILSRYLDTIPGIISTGRNTTKSKESNILKFGRLLVVPRWTAAKNSFKPRCVSGLNDAIEWLSTCIFLFLYYGATNALIQLLWFPLPCTWRGGIYILPSRDGQSFVLLLVHGASPLLRKDEILISMNRCQCTSRSCSIAKFQKFPVSLAFRWGHPTEFSFVEGLSLFLSFLVKTQNCYYQ
jgi:hypothetical protein